MTTHEKRFVLVIFNKNMTTLRCVKSQEEEHFGLKWRVFWLMNKNGSFSCYAFCSTPRNIENPWTVTVESEIRYMKVSGLHHKLALKSCTFGDDPKKRMFTFLMFTKEQVDRYFSNGSSLIIEIHVRIVSMSGFEKPMKMRYFDENNKHFSDAMIKIGLERFYVSKFFLASQSPFFRNLLMDLNKEAFVLNDVDPDDFHSFLELLHMEQPLTDSNIEGVTKLAKKWDAKNAIRVCEQFLLNESKHSGRNKLRIASQCNLETLRTNILENLKNRADVRVVLGVDPTQFDASTADTLQRMFDRFDECI